jgi:hypothetical protein
LGSEHFIFFLTQMTSFNMPEVFGNVDPEVSAVMLEPLLARPNITTAVYSRQNQTLTVEGTGPLRETLQSVLQYRLDQLTAIRQAFDASVIELRSQTSTEGAAAE